MRTIILILSLVMLFTSCETKTQKSISISVMADKTYENIPAPEPDVIKSITGFDTLEFSSVLFTYQIISNTDFNKRYSASLEPNSVLGNKLKRKSDVQKFYRVIDTLLLRESGKAYTYQNSSIFIPLIQNLEFLSKQQSTKKVLLLYSDISEFSDVFNSYSYQNQQLLFKHPQRVVKQFKSHLNQTDFSGIELYIIFYPTTPIENKLFTHLCKVYKGTFKDTGLTIHIGIDKQLKNE